jgi:hypothetical protein
MRFSVPPEIVAILPYNCVVSFRREYMPFIKHGDGKIIDVLDENDLTEEQKKSVKKMSGQLVKQSDESTDSSQTKKSGS